MNKDLIHAKIQDSDHIRYYIRRKLENLQAGNRTFSGIDVSWCNANKLPGIPAACLRYKFIDMDQGHCGLKLLRILS